MSRKTKTLLIIAGMIGVYFIALNLVLKNKAAAFETGKTEAVAAGDARHRASASSQRGGITGE